VSGPATSECADPEVIPGPYSDRFFTAAAAELQPIMPLSRTSGSSTSSGEDGADGAPAAADAKR